MFNLFIASIVFCNVFFSKFTIKVIKIYTKYICSISFRSTYFNIPYEKGKYQRNRICNIWTKPFGLNRISIGAWIWNFSRRIDLFTQHNEAIKWICWYAPDAHKRWLLTSMNIHVYLRVSKIEGIFYCKIVCEWEKNTSFVIEIISYILIACNVSHFYQLNFNCWDVLSLEYTQFPTVVILRTEAL